MDFAERLKELRQKNGISQAVLAEKIHVSRSAVAKWENGLGLPAEDSLTMLADYFGVSEDVLLDDMENERGAVEKNRTIDTQMKALICFAIGAGLGLVILAYLFVEPLRECLQMVVIGVCLICLGAFNIKGNIGSIHWYNRRKVTKENQLPYCRLVGSGTVTVGAAIMVSAVVQSTILNEAGMLLSGAITLTGTAAGLVMILIAQFKYNKGIF